MYGEADPSHGMRLGLRTSPDALSSGLVGGVEDLTSGEISGRSSVGAGRAGGFDSRPTFPRSADVDVRETEDEGDLGVEGDMGVRAERGGSSGSATSPSATLLHQELLPSGQPRRPMNAFLVFSKCVPALVPSSVRDRSALLTHASRRLNSQIRIRRPDYQKREPGLRTGEISKKLSAEWKIMSEVCVALSPG